MPGDAADDAYDAAERWQATVDAMLNAGCRPCACRGLDPMSYVSCPTCNDTGWLDEDGNPVDV